MPTLKVSATSDWNFLRITTPGGSWGRLVAAQQVYAGFNQPANARVQFESATEVRLFGSWNMEVEVNCPGSDIQLFSAKGEWGQIDVRSSLDAAVNNMHRGQFGDRASYDQNLNLRVQ